MASIPSREIHLVRRAEGEPSPENFALVETTLGEPGPGEVRVQNLWLSVDPYMRGLMGTTRTAARTRAPSPRSGMRGRESTASSFIAGRV